MNKMMNKRTNDLLTLNSALQYSTIYYLIIKLNFNIELPEILFLINKDYWKRYCKYIDNYIFYNLYIKKIYLIIKDTNLVV